MANWTGVITNAGNMVLNEWVNEKALSVDRAAAGQGTVSIAGLLAQTALVSQRQKANLLGGEKDSNGIRLKLRLPAADAAYTLNQIGVWASVTGGEPIMIALFQHEQGIPIPSKLESPDFLYTFYGLITCSNTGEWNVNVDTSVAATVGDLTAHAGNKENPHGVTAAQTGAIPSNQKGVAGGVATLDGSCKVPVTQLPPLNYDPAGAASTVQQYVTAHINDRNNPHHVTAAQVGADPSGSAVYAANAVQQNLTAHINNKSNPHNITAAQVGALSTAGGSLSGYLIMQGNQIQHLGNPRSDTDAVNKMYVDGLVGNINTVLDTINGEVV